MYYKSLQVNRFDLKSDLNSFFRKKLPVYDLEMSLPNCHTFRCRFLTMHLHRVVVDHANSVYIIKGQYSSLNKLNMVFHTNSFAPLRCGCPRWLDIVSRRLKKIAEEESGYHKPFSFDLKDIVDCKMKPFGILSCRS